jgi:hypothetical protein
VSARDATTTLVELPNLKRVARSRTGRRICLAILLAFVLAGLLGGFGVRTATVTSRAGRYELRVSYGAVTRPGLDTPFVIEVISDELLDDETTVAVDQDYLELFDENGGLNPEASDSSADGRYVYWTFSTPHTNRLKVSLDAIVATGREWGDRGSVALLDGSKRVVRVDFRTRVAP